MKGWVYVITNKAMPDLVKIGYTDRHPDARASELGGTGNPYAYEIQYCALVNNARIKEQKLHQIFAAKRAGKEWFKLELSTVVAKIISEFGSEILHEEKHMVSAEEIRKATAIEKKKVQQILHSKEQEKQERIRLREHEKQNIYNEKKRNYDNEIKKINSEIEILKKSTESSPEKYKETLKFILSLSALFSFFGFIFVGDLLAGIIIGVMAAFIILGLLNQVEEGFDGHKMEKLYKKKAQLKEPDRL